MNATRAEALAASLPLRLVDGGDIVIGDLGPLAHEYGPARCQDVNDDLAHGVGTRVAASS